MVTGKSPIVPMIWVAHGQPLNDASEEVPMVTQLDEERRRFVGVGKGQLGKGARFLGCHLTPKKWNRAQLEL
jgi:hypothetical protein